jgi:hypothetical protein
MVITVPVQPRERVVKNVPGAGREKDRVIEKTGFLALEKCLRKIKLYRSWGLLVSPPPPPLGHPPTFRLPLIRFTRL